MQSQAERLSSVSVDERNKFLATLSEHEIEALLYDWRGFMARPDQIAPDGDWDIWLTLAGRGWGKTRTGGEYVKEMVDGGHAGRIALIAETAADGRDVMVEGESGILSLYPYKDRPLYQPSKRRITWENGAIATIYNATEPDQLRGPQHDLAWSDEIAKWKYARATWDQLQFGLRLGNHPRQIVTTTPRPIELVKSILAGKEGKVVITRGKTLDNSSNLAGAFLAKIQERYSGTRLGRQELDGEVLGDLPGALWRLENIDQYRVREAPQLDRIVVSVDPAVTNTENSDEHGIIAAGISGKQGYLLGDYSVSGTPLDWARRAISAYDELSADAIVIEVNQGGDMVAQTLRSVRRDIRIIEVRASRGKHVRAEPIAALSEQGRICHVGSYPELENQMTLMTNAGYEGENSPDRVDAYVWAFAQLFPSMTRKTEPQKFTPMPIRNAYARAN